MRRRDRGLTVSLSYVQTLAITTILIAGLIVSFGSHVDRQRDRVAGQQLAGQLIDVDHLVRATDGSADITIEPDLPGTVAGRSYTVEVEQVTTNDYRLVLRTNPGSVTVTVSFTARTAVAEVAASGGANLQIQYSGTAIEVTNE